MSGAGAIIVGGAGLYYTMEYSLGEKNESRLQTKRHFQITRS